MRYATAITHHKEQCRSWEGHKPVVTLVPLSHMRGWNDNHSMWCSMLIPSQQYKEHPEQIPSYQQRHLLHR